MNIKSDYDKAEEIIKKLEAAAEDLKVDQELRVESHLSVADGDLSEDEMLELVDQANEEKTITQPDSPEKASQKDDKPPKEDSQLEEETKELDIEVKRSDSIVKPLRFRTESSQSSDLVQLSEAPS